ncbi:hypothetical protein PR256_03495 [Metamycoplasma hyosynoviae]|uniref:hypothetical protein n=4 Tax=Metamycoplasma hyosynoviae TaxID=29559 RepID=UPI00235873F2|nr:hypothetical protein [Metamycoplasma hyosynoviae]MDC8917400.1 hypothetical protein [Metamycoplasma hyosynoviae]MDD1377945.1 hypothetical protein [Metamycoplasma hyosynoviae]MDD7847898.1 hypothetical protein [Metamycoplasma hyosynoviae]
MKKLLFSSMLLASTTFITTISCKNIKPVENNNVVNSETNQYFQQKFVNKALEIKKIMREFNEKYYLFFQEYSNLATLFSELIVEQSIEVLKSNLQKYYDLNFNIENANIEPFSKSLFKLNWLIKTIISRLSDLNFYLENNDFDKNPTKLEDAKIEIDKSYDEFIFNKNYDLKIFEEETPPPLLNVIKLLKDVLEEIKQGKSEGKLLKFYGDYKNAKQNIYDNVNHIDLDKNFNIIFTILNEDTNYSIIEKFLELLA